MTDNCDFERLPDGSQALGDFDIAIAWSCVAARMVVDDDDPRCCQLHRAAENGAWMKSDLRKSTPLHLFVRDQAFAAVEKEDPQHFLT